MNEEFKKIVVQMCKELHPSLTYDAIVIATSNLMIAKQVEKQNKLSEKLIEMQMKLLQQ